MVRVLVAPDKFKGSLTAFEVCDAVTNFFTNRAPSYQVVSLPLADGGEGTFELLKKYYNGSSIEIQVHDPLLRPITSAYALSHDRQIALIEMAMASGLQLLPETDRNPLYTSTYGTGEMIIHALEQGVKHIILGIGGSATNDAGIGMATALGYRFTDANNKYFDALTGSDLKSIHSIDDSLVSPLVFKTHFTVLSDVTNTFSGPQGAAQTFAKQKGASTLEIPVLDNGLQHLERLLLTAYQFDCNFPGAGAAGGLGAGAKFFLRAEMANGFEFISSITDLKRKIKDADIIITGEGKIDSQSLAGKVVANVSKIAAQYQKPVIAICGLCELSPDQTRAMGLSECLELSDGVSKEEAVAKAFELIATKLEQSHFFSKR